MASVTKQEIPDVAEFMTDFWAIIKAYYRPESSDEYWKKAIAEADRIARKADNRLCKMLLVTFLHYLEDTYHEQKPTAEGPGRGTGTLQDIK